MSTRKELIEKEMSTGQNRKDAERIIDKRIEDMGKVSTPEAIINAINKGKIVTVGRLTLGIQPVSPLLFLGEGNKTWGDLKDKSKEELGNIFMEYVESQPLKEVLKPILLAGILNPKISEKKQSECKADEISVDILMKDMNTAAKLFVEIIKVTAEVTVG